MTEEVKRVYAFGKDAQLSLIHIWTPPSSGRRAPAGGALRARGPSAGISPADREFLKSLSNAPGVLARSAIIYARDFTRAPSASVRKG